MDLTNFFLDFALLGATWVLWLLVALSVLSVGVMIDRGLWFRGRDTDTDRFARELKGAVERNEVERLEAKYRDDPAVPVQVALRGLAERDSGPQAASEAMAAEKTRWRRAGDRNLIVLGTLGNNVPFVGLFGTVLGVIRAFHELKQKSAESELQVFQTVSEALVATAIGLLVAIPAVVAFNYFQRRLKVVMAGADEIQHVVLGTMHATAHAKAAPGKAKEGGGGGD
jgi:biopolymer transport protein ExbB/TolQ